MAFAEIWTAIGPALAGAVFGSGWWCWVDAVVFSVITVLFLHYLPGLFASLAALMFNAVRREDLQEYSPYDDGESCRSRTWLFLAYVISFPSLAAVGLLIGDARVPEKPSTWTGIAGVLQCSFVLGRFDESLTRIRISTMTLVKGHEGSTGLRVTVTRLLWDAYHGEVSASAAMELGCAALQGQPVLHVCGDAGACTLGAGAGAPGSLYAYLGTSGWVAGSFLQKTLGNNDFVPNPSGVFTLAHPQSSFVFKTGSILNAGCNLEWAASNLGSISGKETPRWKEFSRLAAFAPAGSKASYIFLI